MAHHTQEEAAHFGIDWNAPIPNPHENVNVPETPLNNVDSVILQSTVCHISDTDDFGIHTYISSNSSTICVSKNCIIFYNKQLHFSFVFSIASIVDRLPLSVSIPSIPAGLVRVCVDIIVTFFQFSNSLMYE